MKIYIDDEYKCHISNDGTMQEVETDFFDGKCKEFIEGYRFVPSGEKWVLPNGTFFRGEMIVPWCNYSRLAAIQAAADRVQAKADEEIGLLLDTIEELIIGGE